MLPLVWCYFPSSSNHQPPQKTTAAPLHTQNGQLNKTNSPAFVHEGFCRSGWLQIHLLQGFVSSLWDIFTYRLRHSVVFSLSLKPKLFAAVVHESFFSGWLQTHLLPRISLLCNMLPTKSSFSRRGDFGDLCRVGRRKAGALCSIEEFRRPKRNTVFPGKKIRVMYNLTCSIWLLKTSTIDNQSRRS